MITQEIIIIVPITFILLFMLLLKLKQATLSKPKHQNVAIILGSGGHTTEMCQMLNKFRFKDCNHFTVITGHSDSISQSFFMNYFNENKGSNFSTHNLRFLKTKRTNSVNQSKLTSIFTTLYASLWALILIIKQLLNTTHFICNGPGICVPYLLIFWLFNKLTITSTKLIFIESWCRVTSISLTGKIVKYLVDEFVTHWQIKDSYIKYYGKLI